MTTTTRTDCTDREVIFSDSVWRVARVQPDRWVIERHGVPVADLRLGRGDYAAEPELIEIAACAAAWQLLPVWVRSAIWRALLKILRFEEPLPFDRPEIHRLAQSTFRARVDRAISERNQNLLDELADDCPFWRMGRAELLEQPPCELLRWYRLLRPLKGDDSRNEVGPGYRLFVKALRHAAGLLMATTNTDGTNP